MIKYKDGLILNQESVREPLDQDPSEGQNWNWEDYEWSGRRLKVSKEGESMANALVGKTSVTYVWMCRP